MKRMFSLICAAVLVLCLAGCVVITAPSNEGIKKVEFPPKEEATDILTCPAQYIRTDGYQEEETYPQIVLIDTKESLEAYLADNHGKYALGCRESVASDVTIGFVTAVEGYDEAWFEGNTLVMAVVEEGSGSNRHEAQGITADGKILIKRLIPEVGTCDMAVWHILLEVPKDSPVLEKELSVEFVYEEGWVAPPVVASYASRHASVQVTLPGEGWEWEEISDTGGDEPFGIRFWPTVDKNAWVELCCHPDMLGLCGTDLSTDKLRLNNGKTAYLYYYGRERWFLISFEGAGYYYAEHGKLAEKYDEEIITILQSAVVGEGCMEEEKAIALAAEVSGILPEYPRAEFDINTGVWTVDIGTLERSAVVVINDIGGIESITYGE